MNRMLEVSEFVKPHVGSFGVCEPHVGIFRVCEVRMLESSGFVKSACWNRPVL
ncbi:hypothetical protein HanRHA438_Chr06g0252681 [Helianthus annuus]|nr:hypothetical protein HanRHA438_Chr06g0252681 [Helianthus annuus]